LVIRMVAMDLDDTLLRHDLTISERTIRSINKAREKGVLVTVATGRMPLSCQRFIEQLEIKIPVITCHGAIVKDMESGEIIYRKVIESKIVAEVIQRMQSEKMHCQIYVKDKIYTNMKNEWSEKWRKLSNLQAEEADLFEILQQEEEGAEKIVSIDDEGLIFEKYTAFQPLFDGRVHLTMSKPNFLEMSDTTVNKGAALEFLAQKHGIKREEIMAIGDSLNDLEMIRYAGLGVAMGNARSEVKKEADYITGTNNEEGVAAAIEKFVLGE